ncbi:MAG TPA: J domain-containing protein [Candidatus Nitrosotalea sp.]|nr:J domain-containing protein [Candidatus Nitrosotalea sp.]
MNSDQCYSLLGLNPGASMSEIRNAYRRLALEYHPDKNISSKDGVKFKLITEAYQNLRIHNKNPSRSSNSVHVSKTSVDSIPKKIRTWNDLYVLDDVVDYAKKIRYVKTISNYLLEYKPVLIKYGILTWKHAIIPAYRLVTSSCIRVNSFIAHIGLRRLTQSLLKYLGIHS